MTEQPVPGRDDVIAMLASYGAREPQEVPERIDSLELAWLLHQVEQRFGVELDLSDDVLVRMSTVTEATRLLGEAMAAA